MQELKLDFTDRRVLVTGASSGIGRAIAIAFGQAGSHVAVHYNSRASEASEVAAQIHGEGSFAELLREDLSLAGAGERLANAAMESLGGLDIVVNSAGSMIDRTFVSEASDDFIDAVFNINARPMMAVNRRLIPRFLAQGHGCIINITSPSARTGGSPGTGVYGATKAYVSTYTRALAKELAPQGIRANAISPGIIDTPIHHGITSAELMGQLVAAIPMGRLGVTHECAGAALYLASETLAGYVTGQIIEVNGGYLMP